MALSTRLEPALRDVARQFIADEDVPGVSLVIVRGPNTASAHAGVRDVSGGQTADDRTLYRIGSISKTFTAWGALALRDAGWLSLDDAVVEHLPEFAAVRDVFGPITRITTRMLLQHTSGLQGEPPGDAPGPWRPLPIAELLSRLDRTEVVIPPGSAYKYSNVGYDLLGELISRVSGAPYATYLRREILGPLGMGGTTLEPSADQARATGFDPHEPGEPRGPWRPATDHGPGAGQASGGWWSCIDDLATWARTQLGPVDGSIPVSGGSLEEMHAAAFTTDDRGSAYGLGWRVAVRGGRTVVGHGGITYGFEGIIGFDRDAGAAAIALANGIPSTGAMLELRDILLDLASDRPGVAAAGMRPRSSAGGAATARGGAPGLVGTFREAGFRNDVTIARGPLLIEADGRRRALLATADPQRFLVGNGRAVGESLHLLRDDSGEVAAIELGGYYFKRIRAPRGAQPESPPQARKEAP